VRVLLAAVLRWGARAASSKIEDGLGLLILGAKALHDVTPEVGKLADRLSGAISGCGCTEDDADNCERDGGPHACPCGCHAAIEWAETIAREMRP
jgi:hypothetical protein